MCGIMQATGWPSSAKARYKHKFQSWAYLFKWRVGGDGELIMQDAGLVEVQVQVQVQVQDAEDAW